MKCVASTELAPVRRPGARVFGPATCHDGAALQLSSVEKCVMSVSSIHHGPLMARSAICCSSTASVPMTMCGRDPRNHTVSWFVELGHPDGRCDGVAGSDCNSGLPSCATHARLRV